MKRLIPLFDHKGVPQLWLGPDEWLYDRQGKPAAYIVEDGIFSVRGIHIAWWDSASVLASDGSVMLVTRAGNPWVGDAPYQTSRPAPSMKVGPAKPAPGHVPAKFTTKRGWTKPDTLMSLITIEQSLRQHKIRSVRLSSINY